MEGAHVGPGIAGTDRKWGFWAWSGRGRRRLVAVSTRSRHPWRSPPSIAPRLVKSRATEARRGIRFSAARRRPPHARFPLKQDDGLSDLIGRAGAALPCCLRDFGRARRELGFSGTNGASLGIRSHSTVQFLWLVGRCSRPQYLFWWRSSRTSQYFRRHLRRLTLRFYGHPVRHTLIPRAQLGGAGMAFGKGHHLRPIDESAVSSRLPRAAAAHPQVRTGCRWGRFRLRQHALEDARGAERGRMPPTHAARGLRQGVAHFPQQISTTSLQGQRDERPRTSATADPAHSATPTRAFNIACLEARGLRATTSFASFACRPGRGWAGDDRVVDKDLMQLVGGRHRDDFSHEEQRIDSEA